MSAKSSAPRVGDFVYLYSSMTTLDIRATLQCGQQVEVTGRYDQYFGVRTANGQTGYVPIDFLLLLKTAPGAKPVLRSDQGNTKRENGVRPSCQKAGRSGRRSCLRPISYFAR